MKNSGATLMEVLIVFVFVAVIIGLATSFMGKQTNNTGMLPYVAPGTASALANQDIAEQLRIQNELKARELAIKERELGLPRKQ